MNNPLSTGHDRGSGPSVLLVDGSDQATHRASGLASGSIRVTTVATAEDALSRLESSMFDCVVSDYRLPDADGITLLTRVRAAFPSLPFVLWADRGDEALASEAIREGVNDYVPRNSLKPPDYAAVRERVLAVVAAARNRWSVERGERTYRAAFEVASDPMLVFDGDECVEANPAAADLLGCSNDDLVGGSVGEFVSSEYGDDTPWDETPPSADHRGTLSLVHPDGSERSTEFIATPEVLPGRRVIVVRDEREREFELFRSLVDHVNDGLFVIDPDSGDFLDVNDTACRQLGYEREELLSMSVPDINPNASAETWDEFVRAVREDGVRTVETEHRRKDGSIYPVEIEVAYVSLDRDYQVATTRDVTERRERARELEAARKRYQTLIETAPDPIFVADVDTGRIVETNEAASRIRGQPRDEIVGLHQSDLHPEEDEDRYRKLFRRHVERSGTVSRFDDGSPVEMVTAAAERIPVSISTETVTIGDRTLIHGIFRDVSDRIRYEESLKGINVAARGLLYTETDAEIARKIVDVATDVVGLSAVAIYLYDDRTGVLVPAAHSDAVEEIVDDVPTFAAGEGIAWRVFVDQELAAFDDVRLADDVYNAGTPIRSEFVVPLGEHGVFIAGDTRVGAFDDITIEIAELLTASAEAALDRATWVQALRERERESRVQSRRLERLELLNEKIRSINRILVQAETREEINRAVCDALVGLDQFEFAWIGEPNLATNELVPKATAGANGEYLSAISLSLDPDNETPAVRAVLDRRACVEPNFAGSITRGEWRDQALRHGFRSTVSVPLLHDDILYGVLAIYWRTPGYVDELSTAVLSELGTIIGYAINAVDQRNALLGNGAVDLTFEISGVDDVFVGLASDLVTEIEIVNISARSGGTYLAHVTVEAVDPDRVVEVASAAPSIAEIRPLSLSESPVFEVITVGDCIATKVASLGARPRRVFVSERVCKLTISIPRDRDLRTFVRLLEDQYPSAELKAQQEGRRPPSTSWTHLLDERLTERQREILKTAYFSGYYQQPRARTGAEIAASLGISQPAFSRQLRVAEQKLISSIYGER